MSAPDLTGARRFVSVQYPEPGEAWWLLADGSVAYQRGEKASTPGEIVHPAMVPASRLVESVSWREVAD